MATIRVFARIKPNLGGSDRRRKQDSQSLRDPRSQSEWLAQENDQQLSIESPTGNARISSHGSRSSTPSSQAKKRTFKFDGVLSERTTQEEVFDRVASNVVDHFVDGFNGTIFAYGVTGSGKTYTVEGSSRKYAERGLIARCLGRLYALLASKEGMTQGGAMA